MITTGYGFAFYRWHRLVSENVVRCQRGSIHLMLWTGEKYNCWERFASMQSDSAPKLLPTEPVGNRAPGSDRTLPDGQR